jgi:hypothetical protein
MYGERMSMIIMIMVMTPRPLRNYRQRKMPITAYLLIMSCCFYSAEIQTRQGIHARDGDEGMSLWWCALTAVALHFTMCFGFRLLLFFHHAVRSLVGPVPSISGTPQGT